MIFKKFNYFYGFDDSDNFDDFDDFDYLLKTMYRVWSFNIQFGFHRIEDKQFRSGTSTWRVS